MRSRGVVAIIWLLVTGGSLAAIAITDSPWPVAAMVAGWLFCVWLRAGFRVFLRTLSPHAVWEPGNANLNVEDYEPSDARDCEQRR